MIKLILATVLLFTTAAFADDVTEELRALKAKEPTIDQVQQAALTHFGVNGERVSGMRTGASWKAAIPVLEVSGGATGATINDTTILDEYDPDKPWVIRGASGNALEVRTTLAWDLPRFIYNPEELDVARLATVQKDVITHVTQVYFARRRLQLQMASSRTADATKRAAQELRVEELTAVLSGLTGGWFAKALTQPKTPEG